MTMQIKYEWCYETWDENDDIIDNDFADLLNEFNSDRVTNHLVLVRNEGDEINGLADRFWAYVEDGKLPKYFSDSEKQINIKVPQRFSKELKDYNENIVLERTIK